jgi:hypothetical protein
MRYMTNIENQNPVQQLIPTPKKSPKNAITIIIIILALIVGAMYFFTKNSPANSAMVPYLYGMNNELRFSYPSNWYPHDKHGRLFLLKAPNTPDIPNTEIYAYGDQITVSDFNLTDNQGNRLTREQYDAYITENPPATKDLEGNPVTRTKVTINGIPMTRIDQLEYAGSYRTLTYEIPKGDLMYEIRLFPYEKKNIEDLEALIQTVKFAE